MTNEELLREVEHSLIKLAPSPQLHFEVHLTEHCNLNCKQCTHYSPIAEEEFIDINSYTKDCIRLSELFDGEMSVINFLGGEPLLHPQVTEIMKITRELFPIGKLQLVTNGLLLPSMSEDFWEACKMYDVVIAPTYYRLKIDYADLNKTANSKGVKIIPSVSEHYANAQFKLPIGLFDEDPRSNFFYCKPQCPNLKNGKMYPCPIAAHFPLLKKYFNLDMPLSKKNGIDIYSVKTGDELLEKLARPIPFCQYCDIEYFHHMRNDWGISKKDRYEWLAFGFTEEDIQYLKTKKPVVYVFGAGEWGCRAVTLLQNEGIVVKNVLATRKKEGIDNILGVPIVMLNELEEVESNSICLVALSNATHKREVYPLLSQVDFEDVIPIYLSRK